MQLWAKPSLSCSSYWQTLEQIEQAFDAGTVPQVFRLLKSEPILLTHLWGQFHALVLHGDLPRVLKEMVGLVVATATHCEQIHTVLWQSLVQQCAEQQTLAAIACGDYQAADVSHVTRAILRYTNMALVNRTACHSQTQTWRLLHHQTRQALDDTGLEEGEQFELMATIALFEQLCTMANLLEVNSSQS